MSTETLSARALDFELGRVLFGYYTWEVEGKGFSVYFPSENGGGWPVNPRYEPPASSAEAAWRRDCPHFSSDITSAFAVVAVMRERGWEVSIASGGQADALWEVELESAAAHYCWYAEDASLPVSICQCALKALHAEQARTEEAAHG